MDKVRGVFVSLCLYGLVQWPTSTSCISDFKDTFGLTLHKSQGLLERTLWTMGSDAADQEFALIKTLDDTDFLRILYPLHWIAAAKKRIATFAKTVVAEPQLHKRRDLDYAPIQKCLYHGQDVIGPLNSIA